MAWVKENMIGRKWVSATDKYSFVQVLICVQLWVILITVVFCNTGRWAAQKLSFLKGKGAGGMKKQQRFEVIFLFAVKRRVALPYVGTMFHSVTLALVPVLSKTYSHLHSTPWPKF